MIKKGSRLVDAVWPGIVDEAKFDRVQRLMAANTRTRHNGVRPVRHAYVLSGNLLHCGRCGSTMEGDSGTGRLGVKYFYYRCRGADCGLRIAADEIEAAVIGRVRELATAGGLLDRIVEETNKRMARQRPTLLARRRAMQKGLQDVKAEADKVLAEWSALEAEAGRSFLADKLSELAQRRGDLERGMSEVDGGLTRLDHTQVTAKTVREALFCFGEVYACLTPFEKKELVRLVLHRAEVADRQIVLELYPIQVRELTSPIPSRPGTLNWLPEQDSNLQPSG